MSRLLPPEIRNQIYELTLVRHHGLHVRSYQGRYRRKVKACAPSACLPQYSSSHGRHWLSNAQSSETQSDGDHAYEIRQLVPALLATCKVIYDEASRILYGQTIIVSDTYAMQAFLLQLGARATSKLKSLQIAAWCNSRTHKSVNLPAFTLLRDAPHLEKLRIDCMMGYYRVGNRETSDTAALAAARKLYRACFPWIEAVVRQRGLQALSDVLVLNERNFYMHRPTCLPGDSVAAWEAEHAKANITMITEIGRLLKMDK